MPTVSVIIPNFNHADYLAERIDSVLAQSFRDFEVILLDDCSTDGSREILERYRGIPGVRMDFNTRNSGSPFRQWNKGLGLATGRYVWIAESDDSANPCFLGELVSRLEGDANAGVAYCWSDGIDSRGRPAPIDYWYHPHRARWASDYREKGVDEVARWLAWRNTIVNASAVVFRRSIAEAIGGADESYRLMGDLDFWIRMLQHSDVHYTAKALNRFRSHGTSVRATMDRGRRELGENYRLLARLLRSGRVDPVALAGARGRLALRWAEWLGEAGWGAVRLSSAEWERALRVDPWLLPRVVKAWWWLRRRSAEH